MPVTQLAPDSVNLAKDALDERENEKIASTVIEDYLNDDNDRKGWLESHATWVELYNQIDTVKARRFDQQSEETVPIMTQAVNEFFARASRTFFSSRKFVNVTNAADASDEDTQRSERIAAHMSYQLGIQDRGYLNGKKKMFLQAALHGSDFSTTYYDEVRRRPTTRRISAENLILPYRYEDEDFDNINRKTHRIFQSVNETRILAKQGYYTQGAAAMGLSSEKNQIRQVTDDATGITNSNESAEDYDKTAAIICQHRLLDLDGDGIAEPYMVWVDLTTKKVLRIQIRYEADDYGRPTDEFGNLIDPDNPHLKRPIEYFTHYSFMPNPEGVYSLGMGHLVGKLNIALNKLLRILIDSGTLSTVGNMSGFIADAIGIKGGSLDLEMGKFKKIPKTVDDIQRSIYQMKFQGPNPVLLQLMEFIQSLAQRIVSAPEVLSGETNYNLQPTTIITMVEQALQQYSAIQEGLAHSIESELKKLFRLNRLYLDREVTFKLEGKRFKVTPEDYKHDLVVSPIFDPRSITKQQQIARAQAEYQLVTSNPLTVQNKNSLYIVTRNYLEALETRNIDEILPKPEEEQPLNVNNQEQENSWFLMPMQQRPLFDVYPEHNHMDHIQRIDAFLQSPYAQVLDEETVMQINDHKRKHMSYLYAQKEGIDGQEFSRGQSGTDLLAFDGRNQSSFNVDAGALFPSTALGTGANMGGSAEATGTEPGVATT